ncbi:DUF4256 domain-containing protein [Terriglobus tenax]|uniref:DUF4256 domain-containing protein n=1 Tax=Terriglobus tenax TaxID=1111115 RepID=UPI0021E0D42E|nr:DUF4256 domain-containing protein [Terriglobus tenax]
MTAKRANADQAAATALDSATNLLAVLKARFEKNTRRHKGIMWDSVEKRLRKSADAFRILEEMERTGGEPDAVGREDEVILFFDCSAESPSGRRSLCYDHKALNARKEHKPANSAINLSESIGVELLTEEQYRYLQTLGEFDTKTSSWIQTPERIRKLGGALFCDRRYDTVFVYHNGAESYYAGRGFRGCLRV